MSLRKKDLYKNQFDKDYFLFLVIGTLGIPILPLWILGFEYITLKWTKYPF